MRDLLLLAVRTIVVVLFVLAMARPYWSAGRDAGDGSSAMHVVLVIDNSLSMGYRQLDKSLLDVAKDKTREFIESLPEGSEVSVIPLCSYSRWHARDVYTTKDGAIEAVRQIELVDRSASIPEGLAQAAKARLASRIPTKRTVFIGDAQGRTWTLDGAEAYLEGVSDLQIVQVGPTERTNSWVADFRLVHGIADTDSPAIFRAVIRHEGQPRRNVQVTLTIDGVETENRDVDLVPGHEMRLDFAHEFRTAGTSAKPLFVPASLKLSTDRLDHLVEDDSRTLIVPVVTRTPVVFIDQHGRRELPAQNVFGETERVRRLLTSRSYAGPGRKSLVKQVLRTIDEITRDDLKDARLVVIAGVPSPTPEAVTLLREYVEQGGNIFIGAGETFLPVQWTDLAWLDGAGILPAPLKKDPIGQAPRPNQRELASFSLDKQSIVGQALYLDTTAEETAKILATPRFFRAVVADMDTALEAIARSEPERVKRRLDQLAKHDANEKRWAELERGRKLSAAEVKQRDSDRDKIAAMSPNWLAWSNPLARDMAEFSADELVSATQPRVLGRYSNGHPFVVQRQIGKGRVIMLTSGLWPVWNTLALDNGVLLLDRIMRSLLVRSLPDRTFGPESEIVIPVSAADQAADFTVQIPGDSEPRLQSVEALGPQNYGLLLRSIQRRGLYQIRRSRQGQDKDEAWTMVLAVNGPAEEGDLRPRSETDLPARIAGTTITWTGSDEVISLAGETYVGHDFWQTLMILALVCMLLEMALLTGWFLASRAKGANSEQGPADRPGRLGGPEASL